MKGFLKKILFLCVILAGAAYYGYTNMSEYDQIWLEQKIAEGEFEDIENVVNEKITTAKDEAVRDVKKKSDKMIKGTVKSVQTSIKEGKDAVIQGAINQIDPNMEENANAYANRTADMARKVK